MNNLYQIGENLDNNSHDESSRYNSVYLPTTSKKGHRRNASDSVIDLKDFNYGRLSRMRELEQNDNGK